MSENKVVVKKSDFKRILAMALRCPFDTYGYGGILNSIALYAYAYAEKCDDEQCPALAKAAREEAGIICDELRKMGYYADDEEAE